MSVTTERLLRYLPTPQIVAVDNNPAELNKITEGLNNIGLPFIPVLYDITTGLNLPSHMKTERLRIIFLDLNLNEIEGSLPQNIAEPIGEVLAGLAPQGPYLLVFWTKHQNQVERVMKILVERKPELSFPSKVSVIDKEPFLGNPDGSYELEDLKKDILKALSEHKLFLAMLAWEFEVGGAAIRTSNMIHSLVTNLQPEGIALKDKDLQDVLKKIALASWGKERAMKYKGAAVTSGLAPILMDQLDSITGKESYTDVWKGALIGSWNRPLPSMLSPALLNTSCLVDINSRKVEDRGVWLEFSEGSKRKTKAVWFSNFGTTRKELVEHFINPESGSRSKEILNSVGLGMLECTAACDYNNNKAPLRRFILCAKVPIEFGENISWDNPNRKTKHDAIHKINSISIAEHEYLLFLNFKYVLALHEKHILLEPDITQPIFRIRSQVLSDISTRFASHTTRPGLYSF